LDSAVEWRSSTTKTNGANQISYIAKKKAFRKKIKVHEFMLFNFKLFKLDPPASNILLMINREIDCERKCKVGKNQFMQHARHW
jgi:hypothetical protein